MLRRPLRRLERTSLYEFLPANILFLESETLGFSEEEEEVAVWTRAMSNYISLMAVSEELTSN
jgi:hypothetical protein